MKLVKKKWAKGIILAALLLPHHIYTVIGQNDALIGQNRTDINSPCRLNVVLLFLRDSIY
jgi:hypothetical protein